MFVWLYDACSECLEYPRRLPVSSSSPLSNESPALSPPETLSRYGSRARQLASTLRSPAQFLSFWIAITLPFLYVPLLVNGLGSASVAVAFVALLVLNVFTLYLGHGYNQP